jgi:ribosomal protein L11 methyltransferase
LGEKTAENGGWRVAATVPVRAADVLADALAGQGLAVAIGPAGRGRRTLQGYGAEPCDRPSLTAALAVAAATAGVIAPDWRFEALPPTDWAARLQSDFPPRRIGRFFLHGSHHRGKAPRGTIPIRIDAGAAFGTGAHESTEGCLVAIERLCAERSFPRVLDMGTGSGLLAIAVAKFTGAKVLAVDNDPVSVAVARENVKENDVANLVRVARSDGYRGLARDDGPFDLVLANILARPLVRMAPAVAKRLAPGGVVVLAGFLAKDAGKVAEAHRAAGLAPLFRVPVGDWTTLVMTRPRRRAGKG